MTATLSQPGYSDNNAMQRDNDGPSQSLLRPEYLVRPESLSLQSPLTQLTRQLSWNHKQQHSNAGGTAAAAAKKVQGRVGTPMAFIAAGNSSFIDSDDEDKENIAVGSNAPTPRKSQRSQAEIAQPSSSKYVYSYGDISTKSTASEGKLGNNSASYTAPVRFSRELSNDSDAYDNDQQSVSDAHSQLINAFRNSYADGLSSSRDRSAAGPRPESSYSWMTATAADHSPVDTLDFAQAARNAQAGAYRAIRSRRSEDGYQPQSDENGTNSVADYARSITAKVENVNDVDPHQRRNYPINSTITIRTSADEWENEELATKAYARRSSWDSTNPQNVDTLRDLQHDNVNAAHAVPTAGRESAMSGADPFMYDRASNAYALSEATALARTASARSQQVQRYQANNVNHPMSMVSVYPPTEPDDAAGRGSVYAYPLTPQSETGLHSPREGVSSHYFADTSEERQSRAKSQVSAINLRRPWQMSNMPREDVIAEYVSQPVASTSQLPSLPRNSTQRNLHTGASPISHPMRLGYQPAAAAANTGSLAPPVAPSLLRTVSHEPISTKNGGAGLSSYARPAMQHAATYNDGVPFSQLNDYRTVHNDGSPSQASQKGGSSISSAISKHRAQRRAAGLSTEGKYYVDPKTGKHYFVPASGAKTKGKERAADISSGALGSAFDAEPAEAKKKPKERRKLHKKEAGWELSKFRPQSEMDLLNMQSRRLQPSSAPVTPEQQQGAFDYGSIPMIQDYSAMSGGAHTPGGGQVIPEHWKPWSDSPSARGNDSRVSSREGTPYGQDDRSMRSAQPDRSDSHDTSTSQEWINIPSPNASPVHVRKPQHGQSKQSNQSSPEQHLHPPTDRHSPLQAKLSHATAGSQTRHRTDSVYSSYSYYGDLPASPSQSPGPNSAYRSRSASTSPQIQRLQPLQTQNLPPQQSSSGHGSHERTGSQSTAEYDSSAHSPVHSPLVRTDTTLTKISKHTSLQLLATTKHNNLTVPKTTGSKKDQIDLSELDPNHPLVSLHLGIDAHECGDMEQSIQLFAKSANQGFGLGMLMYGLALRHGWGTEAAPEEGFQYLRRAAETVVPNLDEVVADRSRLSAADMAEQSQKSELVLSIYELGQCYFRGWGVLKDKKAALRYFELAADMGDPDAQTELGFCYSAGRGCKKDLKKAAKYYRLAEKQGSTSYGMQWIWKAKYDD